MGSSSPAGAQALEMLRQFVNTRDIEAGTDAFVDEVACSHWLNEHGLLDREDPVGPDDLARVHLVRETIRGALLANHDGAEVPADLRDVLNEGIRDARLNVMISADGWTMRPETTGVARALGELLAAMLKAMAEGTWERLKVCGNEDCRWAFYDRSPGRARKWCSMGLCGNRAKQQTWRRSQTEGDLAR
ncbi:MAG: CGNR zinc finger domain-containing protein [Actinobacteria bacterium]|nr:CGNR zinc finger domain-containing protein [Actinomycetota bacterium]MBU1494880.1 CGNR zinc finger domain-containing protein [Actinomycetota bacterium]MBU1866576.1 CGNR zinc finger domain-containing protein [Actinomycetota bacterium]